MFLSLRTSYAITEVFGASLYKLAGLAINQSGFPFLIDWGSQAVFPLGATESQIVFSRTTYVLINRNSNLIHVDPKRICSLLAHANSC